MHKKLKSFAWKLSKLFFLFVQLPTDVLHFTSILNLMIKFNGLIEGMKYLVTDYFLNGNFNVFYIK